MVTRKPHVPLVPASLRGRWSFLPRLASRATAGYPHVDCTRRPRSGAVRLPIPQPWRRGTQWNRYFPHRPSPTVHWTPLRGHRPRPRRDCRPGAPPLPAVPNPTARLRGDQPLRRSGRTRTSRMARPASGSERLRRPACAPARTPFHVRALVPRPVRQKENLIMPNEQGFYGPHLALRSSALPLRREAQAAPAINNVDELRETTVLRTAGCGRSRFRQRRVP